MATVRPAAASVSDLTGSTVGRFAIGSLLGAGGMGEVYCAHDTKLKRPVALKRLSQEFGADPRARQRILKEAQRACALNSPHIAGIYDVLERQDDIFLVMEYVEGSTLRHRLRAGSFPLEEFFAVALQCAQALDAAHQKAIIHRDIKPENIMLTGDGQVKVLDFGLARRLPSGDERAATVSLDSQVGTLAGTPGYMAPEALLEKELDARSDIFSLGVTFYEMLTGQHPFRASKMMATVDRVLNQSPTPVSQQVRDAPPDLDRVIAKMLAKNPAERYATAADLLVDLRALQRGSAIALPSPAPRTFRNRLSSLLRSALAIIGIAILLTAFPGLQRQWRQWRGTADLPQRKHLAVLPFTTDDPAVRPFSQGLTEALTARLTQLSARYPIQMVPAAEISTQKITSVQQARAGLGVNLVLEGSMRHANGTVRVIYNLVDASTRRELRADVITADASNPFAVEDRVIASVLNALEIELAAAEQQSLARRGTSEPAAYDLYLRGRGYLQEYHSLENIESAITNFQRVLERDPRYALAYAGLGEAYWHKYMLTHNSDWVDKALDSCKQAVVLGTGHACLGRVYNGTGRYEEAAKEFQRAVEADATDDSAYRGLASAYEKLGKLADAEATYRRAISVRPQYWAGYSWLGAFLYSQTRFDEAAEMFKQVTVLAPDSYRGYYNLAGTYIAQGRYEQALVALQKSVSIRPSPSGYSNLGTAYFYLRRFADAVRAYEAALKLDDGDYVLWGNLAEACYWTPGAGEKSVAAHRRAIALAEEHLKVNARDARALGWLAIYHAALGDRKIAQAFLGRALEISGGDPEIRLRAALVYIELGDRERSIQWLEKAVAAGLPPSQVRDSPEFDRLAGEARFRKLIQDPAGPRT